MKSRRQVLERAACDLFFLYFCKFSRNFLSAPSANIIKSGLRCER